MQGAVSFIQEQNKGERMKSITIETLSGKKFFIDNVGSYFMVNDESFEVANFFSTIKDCLDYITSKS